MEARHTDANLMAVSESTLSFQWPVKHVRTDVVRRRLLLVLFQEIVEGIVRAVRAVVEAVAHGHGLRHEPGVIGQARELWRRALVAGRTNRPPCEDNVSASRAVCKEKVPSPD